MSAPVISVVMPVHNIGPWLRECLSSLLDDQDVDLEVIAVDDASTDDGWEILEERAATDPRLRPVRNTGKGGASARNYGVELARGEFLAFVDGDDLVPRDAYRAMLDAIQASGSEMVVGSFLKFFPSRTWRPTTPWPAWHEERRGVTLVEQPSLIRNRACWNRLFRLDFWRAQGIMFPSVPRSNDVVPMTRALVAACSIDVVRDTVYLYRARPGASSMTARAHGAENFVSYMRQEQQSLELTSSLGDAGMRALHESLFARNDGWVHLRTFLAGSGIAASTEEELEEARLLLASLYSELASETVEGLGWEKAWCFEFAIAGNWADARAVALASEAADPAAGLELVRRVVDGGTVAPERARHLLDALVLNPLSARTEPAPELAPLLAASRDLIVQLCPADSIPGMPAGPQHILGTLATGDDAALTRLLEQEPLRVAFRRVTQEPSGPVARVVHLGPVGSGLTFYVVRDGVRRDLKAVDLAWDAEPMMAAFPVRRLGTGDWALRFTATFDGILVDAPVALSPAAPRSAVAQGYRLHFRRLVPSEDSAWIMVGRPRWKRAANRVRHASARRVRRIIG
jgi:hypothetical protein